MAAQADQVGLIRRSLPLLHKIAPQVMVNIRATIRSSRWARFRDFNISTLISTIFSSKMADKDLEFENSETPVDGATGSTIELPAEKEEQYQRIVRNLQEATSTDIIRKVLSDGKTVKCYWGVLMSFDL